ncbi:hypothetical protein KY284_021175 [Solanum tuberosum]|nr:hypothetical protein KY284_021175 [Solanum tuberosum]
MSHSSLVSLNHKATAGKSGEKQPNSHGWSTSKHMNSEALIKEAVQLASTTTPHEPPVALLHKSLKGLRICCIEWRMIFEFRIIPLYFSMDFEWYPPKRSLCWIERLEFSGVLDGLMMIYSPCSGSYLIVLPSQNLEKRVVPRMQVLKILDEKKLKRRELMLYTVVRLTESKFMEYFVLPYKDKIPDLFRHTGSCGLPSLLPVAVSGPHLSENSLFGSVGFSKDDEAISTATKLFFISGSWSQFCYSTNATVHSQNPLLSNYLIKSLGFSRYEANAAAAKLNSVKAPKNPDLVIKFFQEMGLERTEIKKLVSITPRLLFSDVNRTLKPKFQCLREVRVSGSDLVDLFLADGKALYNAVGSHLRSNLDFLRKLVSNEETLVKLIKRSPYLLAVNGPKRFEPKILLLQKFGFSNDQIEKLILQKPRILLQKFEWLEEILHKAEKDLQISPTSGMFMYGVLAVIALGKSTVENKMGVFRSCGWCDQDIMTVFRKQPLCLAMSEARVLRALDVFTRVLGCKPEYLISNPALLMLSLDKRVIPRNQVLKVLEEKKLNQKLKMELHNSFAFQDLATAR